LRANKVEVICPSGSSDKSNRFLLSLWNLNSAKSSATPARPLIDWSALVATDELMIVDATSPEAICTISFLQADPDARHDQVNNRRAPNQLIDLYCRP
jgi:hypothetical protein